MAGPRFDIAPGVDRLFFVTGFGHLMGLPQRATTSNVTTGVPVNGVPGFAPAALFLNFRGSLGSLLYVNTGTNLSATWTNII